jgi:heptosyltransferase-2
LLIHLGALGAVVRSTGLLPLIHAQYPNAQITWVTESLPAKLLRNHPRIKRVLTPQIPDMLAISNLEFDLAFVIDKDLISSGILNQTKAKKVLGFVSDSNGMIIPANSSAQELWELGLDDNAKFFKNQKSEIQLLAETLELVNRPNGYDLPLNDQEKVMAQQRHREWSRRGQKKIIGINTGCAATLPAKKMTVQNHIDLIGLIQKNNVNCEIILLGGPEDTLRNQEIANRTGVRQSPTEMGLRDGLVSVAACDLVITGDSLGLHMAISQEVPVVVWFGPSCAQEIDLFGRGEKIMTMAECSPCWNRSCNKSVMCYDLVDLNEVVEALNRQLKISELHRANRLPGRSAPDSSIDGVAQNDRSQSSRGIDLP